MDEGITVTALQHMRMSLREGAVILHQTEGQRLCLKSLGDMNSVAHCLIAGPSVDGTNNYQN